jgi:hypothetical protein
MGVWANGPRPDRVDIPGIAEAMRPALEQWMTGRVRIIDPHRGESVGVETILDSGDNGALIQPLRGGNQGDVGGQSVGILGVRFQVTRTPEVFQADKLRGGLLVKVVDGGNAPELERIPNYALSEAIDSSLAWDFIFEATVITGGF